MRSSIPKAFLATLFIVTCSQLLSSCSKSKDSLGPIVTNGTPPVTPTPVIPTAPTLTATVSTIAGTKGNVVTTDFTGPNGIVFDAAGNMYFVIEYTDLIYKLDKAGNISIFAGTGSYGFVNGTGQGASFFTPVRLAIDQLGNIFVADRTNAVIRKITPAGVVTTFAGSGVKSTIDGTLTTGSFASTLSVCLDSKGIMYVGDGSGVIRKISGGTISTIDGTINNADNSSGGYGGNYTSLVTDGDDNLYASDRLHHIIIKVTPNGVVSTLAGRIGYSGHLDGTGTVAILSYPTNLAYSPIAACLYLTEQGTHDVRKITLNGNVTTLAGSGTKGYANGIGTNASFSFPDGIAVDAAGNIFVGDEDNNNIRQISPSGVVTTFVGKGAVQNGTATFSTFSQPTGVTVDDGGVIYVADAGNNLIRKISSNVVSTYAGTGAAGTTDGALSSASFSNPTGLTLDAANNMYVADNGNNMLRKISPSGQVSSIPLAVTSNGASGPLNNPTGVAIDATGNLFYTNTAFNSICKIGGGTTSTYAVGDNSGPAGGLFFLYPYAIIVNKNGIVYIADTNNSRICKITQSGYGTTIAGKASATNIPVSGYADGTGTAAIFNHPQGLAIDNAGNIYVADTGNNRIRKIDLNGVVTTLAGSGLEGYNDGTSTTASFSKPTGITVNAAGNVLYVTDAGSGLIRKIVIQ